MSLCLRDVTNDDLPLIEQWLHVLGVSPEWRLDNAVWERIWRLALRNDVCEYVGVWVCGESENWIGRVDCLFLLA